MVNTPYFAEPFLGLRQAMDRLLDDSVVGSPFRTVWSRGTGAGNGQTMWPLPLDVYATEQEVVVVAAVPGLQTASSGSCCRRRSRRNRRRSRSRRAAPPRRSAAAGAAKTSRTVVTRQNAQPGAREQIPPGLFFVPSHILVGSG
jgi:hypothetical protein